MKNISLILNEMKTTNNSILYFLKFFLVFLLFTSCNIGKKDTGKWIQLFNGENLDGWDVKINGYELNENFGNTFRVEDGLLKVRYDKYDDFGNRFGHLFYKEDFSHYMIRVEYRFVGDQCPGGPGWAFRNSGIMIHGQSAESMAKDQRFPVSVEVQLLGGDGTNARQTANLCTPGTNVVLNGKLLLEHCTNSTSETFHGDQWVSVEVEVHGGEVITHRVNGIEVLQYEKPQLDDRDPDFTKLLPESGDIILRKGSISLQGESHPCDFRKVEILVLKKE